MISTFNSVFFVVYPEGDVVMGFINNLFKKGLCMIAKISSDNTSFHDWNWISLQDHNS